MAPAEPEDGSVPQSSCLSVFGLAFDASEREVHVLFSGCPGFVRCVLQHGKSSTQRPYAFVQFEDQASALAAMESRQGTTWEEGGQKVGLEIAKRDIPDKFKGERQRALESGYGYEAAAYHAPAQHTPKLYPAAKKARLEDYSPDSGPKTLHIGGLPKGLYQQDLDAFLAANFPASCAGATLSGGGGSSTYGRAFVGFTTHLGASEAMAALNGHDWDGAILRAEFARTEWRPPAGADAYAQPPQQAAAPAWGGPRGGGYGGGCDSSYDAWGSGKGKDKGKKGKDKGSGKGKEKAAGATRTLHFTNLPPVAKDEFEVFMYSTFPGMIEICNFKDTQDGRPPVAWVLFSDEGTAAEIAASKATFEWNDTSVRVAYARTDLDPAKFKTS
jgi:hypothetical protein